MKVDRSEPICGIRPAVLKSLLRKGYERFDTPTAMEHLELDEPAVTTTLAALQQGGWIQYLGSREGVDGWRPGNNGQRLLATALLKRIPRTQAQGLLGQLIAEARAINADAAISSRVKQIVLFGSLLTGAPEDTVGDIDVVVTLQRRLLPRIQLEALEENEQADAPDSVHYRESALHWWPQTRLRRRLARLSPYLSFHPDSDLLGSVHQEVYAYDLEHEREVPPNGDLRTRTAPPVPGSESVDNTPYMRASRDWPTAPKRAMVIELDGDKARLAQHLWMNGADIKAIAARIRSRPGSVQAYLACRAPNERRRGPIHASLKGTVLEALPCERNHLVVVHLYHHPHTHVIDVDVFGQRGQHAKLRRTERDYFILQAPVGLLTVLEAADRAAAAWYETMRSQFRGLGVEIALVCTPNETPLRGAGSKRIDLRPLAQPLLALLDRCWKKPRKKYEGYEQRLTVTLEAEPVVTYRNSGGAKPRPMNGRPPQEVIGLARSIHKTIENPLDEDTSFSVFVTGASFEVDEDDAPQTAEPLQG
jgi:hypothetical protein